jgi:hypothetical protein
VSSLGLNPRYAAYARVHGNDAEQQLAADTVRWPGGKMCGYLLWNRARVVEFNRLRPDCFVVGSHLSTEGHAAFDAWLAKLPEGHGVEAQA